MRIVIQRVSRASVTIDGTVKSAIKKGYMILIGICEEDTTEDVVLAREKGGRTACFRQRKWGYESLYYGC